MRSPQTVLLVLVALRIHAVAPEQQSTVTQTVASRKHMQTLHKGSGHLMHVTCSSHGISTTRNHHAIISMTRGTCQQEHTGTHPHTQSELFSVECQVCICRSCSNLLLHTIALHRTSSSSQVLHSSLPSAHGLNAMH